MHALPSDVRELDGTEDAQCFTRTLQVQTWTSPDPLRDPGGVRARRHVRAAADGEARQTLSNEAIAVDAVKLMSGSRPVTPECQTSRAGRSPLRKRAVPGLVDGLRSSAD